MSESELKEIKEGLIKMNLMDETDEIEQDVAGDFYRGTKQVRGHYYFTKERVAFVSGWGLEFFGFRYVNIREIKKSNISLFMPFGVTVTVEDNFGKMRKYKLSLLKRDQWIALLSEKSGVAVN